MAFPDAPEIAFGQSWADLVQQWVEFEQKEGFEERGKLGTANRPECILQWKKRAHLSMWCPDISNVLSFKQEFHTWWISLQPTWWVSEGTMVMSTEGNWDFLRKPGQNGLICVLVGLFYWGRLVQEDGNQCRGWAELVEDFSSGRYPPHVPCCRSPVIEFFWLHFRIE